MVGSWRFRHCLSSLISGICQKPTHLRPVPLCSHYCSALDIFAIIEGGKDSQASLLAVGKPGFAESGRERGSVLIYERGDEGWEPQAELFLAPGEHVPGAIHIFPNPGVTFLGAWAAFEGNWLAVVSTFANAVYVFDRQAADWAYQFRITPGQIGDTFQRRTAAMSGDQLLLGSPGELGGGNVLVFDLTPETTSTGP